MEILHKILNDNGILEKNRIEIEKIEKIETELSIFIDIFKSNCKNASK